MNTKDCENCVVCEKGVVKVYQGNPTTKEFIMKLKAKHNGELPSDALIGEPNAKGCDKCFACENCDKDQSVCQEMSKRGAQQKKKPQQFGITYFVFLTNDCNLRCDYCYAAKSPPEMDEETVLRTIKFILVDEEKRLPNRRIGVQFFGGEPTVKWDLLVYFVETANRMAAKRGQKINWGMTTNGTLLNRDRLRWMRHHSLRPLFSIDGNRETHNKHRKTRDGKGSFDMIPLNLIAAYFPNAEIRPTIMPDTVEDFPKTVKWFYSKGFYTIATEVAYEVEWNKKAMEKARITYEKLGDMYIRRKQAKLPMWMKFIDDGKRQQGQIPTGFVCGIGRNSLAIKATGDIYPCQRYASFADEKLRMGDIWKGFDKGALEKWNDFKREYMTPDPKGDFFCDECPAFYRCRGGCNAMNHQCNGDRRFILQNNCRFQRLWASICLRVLSATRELWGGNQGQGGRCGI